MDTKDRSGNEESRASSCLPYDIQLEVQSCLQKAIRNVNRFQTELTATRKQINDINKTNDSNHAEIISKISDFDNNNHEQRNMTHNVQFHGDARNSHQKDLHLENLINKAEHFLLQVKLQIDLTYIDLEQLKTFITFATNRYLPKTDDEELVFSELDVVNTALDLPKVPDESKVKLKPLQDDDINETWKNWPPFVFMNLKRNKFQQKVCCVMLTKPGTFIQEDIQVHASDTDEDLAKCLESNDEQILSSLVTLESKDGSVLNTEVPFHIYLPVIEHRRSLTPELKYMANGNEWHHSETVNDIVLPTEKELCLLGTEIKLRRLQNLQCVAVAKPQCEKFEVNDCGATFELKNDRNIRLNIPPGAFRSESTITAKTKLLTESDLGLATSRYLELEYVRQTSSLVTINSENPTQSNIEISLYDLGTGENDYSLMTVNQETLARCSRWLVNNLNIIDIESRLDEVLTEEGKRKITREEFNGDKVRTLIFELQHCFEQSTDKFIALLEEVGQKRVADRLSSLKEQVILGRKQESLSVTDLELSSDFDPDFEESVRIVSKSHANSWTVRPVTVLESTTKSHTVKLEAGSTSYSVLGMVVPNKMSNSDVCRAASVLEDASCLTNTTLIVKQHKENPDNIIIHCVSSDHANQIINELNMRGFTEGPQKMPEFGVSDGENIEIKLDANLCLEGFEKKTLMLTFYSNLDTAKFEGRLCILNPEQDNCDKFCGHLSYKVVSKKISILRNGRLSVYLPKPPDEQLGYFSYTVDFAAKALAKFLAWQLTSDNANSTRWIKYANILEQDPGIYKQCVNSTNKELSKAEQRQRCEAFLLYWADHYVHPQENKLDRMIDILGSDNQKRADAHQFIKYYHLTGTLSNESLKKMAYRLSDDWEVMAKKLGLDQSVTKEIKDTQKNQIRQALKMLDIWRLSDAAIMKGTDIIKHFHECAKSAKCSARLLDRTVKHK